MSIETAVAIVGMAFELPLARSWDEVVSIFESGRDCVRPLPAERAAVTGITRSPQDREAGWLDDIAGFDRRYFGISRAEAELMDPRQRRLLQAAITAIVHAGYDPRELRGRPVAVVVAALGGPRTDLSDLLLPEEQASALAFAGSLHALAAGRIAYYLDLHGPAMTVDTACSSFLVALHEARWKLVRGECEAALVGGYSLLLGQPPQRTGPGGGLGVESPTDRCRSFDASSDGAGYGEGGGMIMLKRLADARRDGDTILAVIRGSAVNNDGGRSNGMTAPSPAAQTDVIKAAWRDADIDPATIGYVEAHGTGTRIGDPIEIHGLREAFGEDAFGKIDGKRAPISTAKANFGHLGGMAGLAGLVRVVAQFRAGMIFPTAHFIEPNPLLGLDGAPVRIADRCEPWPMSKHGRRAGISGFGLSGTNAHLVVESVEESREWPAAPEPGKHLILLSATNEGALTALRLALLKAASLDEFDVAAAADVLMLAREHFGHRRSWIVQSREELREALAAITAPPPEPSALVMALGEPGGVTLADIERLSSAYPAFRRVNEEAQHHRPSNLWSAAQRGVVWLAGQQAVLADFGIVCDLVVGHGAGSAAAKVARGDMDLKSALDVADELSRSASEPDPQRLAAALTRHDHRVTILDLSPDSRLSSLLPATGAAVVAIERFRGADAHVLPILKCAYDQGQSLDFRRGFGRPPRRRLELPAPPFAEEPCWPRTAPVRATSEPHEGDGSAVTRDTSSTADDVVPRVGENVLEMARSVLKEPDLSLRDNFFDFGGNSINGAQLIARINDRFGADLDVLDLFDFPDLQALADEVASRSAGSEPSVEAAPVLPRPSGPLSGQQLAILAATHMDSSSGAYNVPGAFLIDGALDERRLATGLQTLVVRHPMLRAVVRNGPEGAYQEIMAPGPISLESRRIPLGQYAWSSAGGRQALLDALARIASEPIEPERCPARFLLLHAEFCDRVMPVLLLSFHHLFFDGWSWRIVMAELGQAYAGQALQAPPARTYLDYVDEQDKLLNGERGRALSRFWSEYLEDVPEHVRFPGATRESSDLGGETRVLKLDSETIAGLRRLARNERATMAMVLLSSWAAFLWRLGGQRDLPIALPVAGRGVADEGIIGCYVNTVLVRVNLDPGASLAALIAEVRRKLLAAMSHADFPTNRILRLCRPHSTAGLTNVMFDFQSGFDTLDALYPGGPGVELLDVGPGGAKFGLSLNWLEYGDTLEARLEHASAQGTPETVEEWAREYQGMLARLASTASCPDLFSLFDQEHAGRLRSDVRLPDFRLDGSGFNDQ